MWYDIAMSDLRDELTQVLTPFVESGAVPGLVALVARGDEIDQIALGVRAIGGSAMTTDSVFRIASMTKPITAMATLVLVGDGLIGRDDPVDSVLPELVDRTVVADLAGPVDDVVPAERAITVRDLLCFTGGYGFPADFSAPVVQRLVDDLGQGPPNPQSVPEPDEWMRRLGCIPLLHQPGRGWTYNAQADILGVLIARLAGRPLPEVLAQRVFRPLEMVDTGFCTRPDQRDRITGYHQAADAGGLELVDAVDGQWSTPPAFPSGAGGLVSTAADWLAFGRMLLAGGRAPDGTQIVTPDLVEEAMTDHTTPGLRDVGAVFLQGQGWGFGGSVDIARGEAWHVPGRYGWIGGTGTAGYVVPATGRITVLMTQVAPSGADVIDAFLTAAAEG